MKVMSMFQRSLLMFMYQCEVREGDVPVMLRRKAIEFAFYFSWQHHYTIATRELKEAGLIEIRNYFGSHEYVLTDEARGGMDNWYNAARRYSRVERWEQAGF